jgi:transcriptional regulator with GAF, ATPase, and Fis domain
VTQPDREQAISRAFVALADTLVDDYDIIDMLDQLASHSVALLAADAAAIMLGDAHRHLRVVAASSDDAKLMELLQLQNEQGPCLDCYHTATPVRVPDVAIADQWPMFAAAVAQAGSFRSVHALPLRLRGKSIGALNLFHHSPGPLPESDLTLGQALADVATIGILQQQAIRRSSRHRTTPDRPEQPSHHRTGQGRARPPLRPDHGGRLRQAAPLHAIATCTWLKWPNRSPVAGCTRPPSQRHHRQA